MVKCVGKLNENMISVNFGGPVLRTWCFYCQGEDGNPVQALVGELKTLQADWWPENK